MAIGSNPLRSTKKSAQVNVISYVNILRPFQLVVLSIIGAVSVRR
jgi:hypothetical protein